MDYSKAYGFLVLIFVRQIVGVTEIYRGNDLWMFYVNNNTNVTESSRHERPRHTKQINVNLSVSYLPVTKSVHRNLKTVCETLTKVKVVALLYPPNFENNIGFTLVGKHLAIPKLNLHKSSEDTQVNVSIISH